MMRRSRVLALLLALMVMACGTRASDERFDAVVRGANGERSEAAALDSGGGDSATFDGGTAVEGSTESADGAPAPGTAEGEGGGAGGDLGAGGSGGDVAGDGAAAPSGDGGPAAAGGGGGPANVASDVGVTETTIKVGSVVSVNGPLGPRQFSPTFYGMNAYVEWINSQGGINGRKLILVTCDDRESEEANRRCAERLVEQEKIFAFLGNNTRVWDTGAAKYGDDNGVPVVGGYTIGLSYTYFPTIFDFGAAGADSGYPRDYKVGQNGFTFTSTAGCVFWAKKGVKRAASIFYSIPISKEAGLNGKTCLESEGIDVVTYEINPAVPNWDAVAADMQQRKIQAAFDYVDIVANQNLCRALDRRGYRLDYKVSTIAVQARWVKKDFSHPCRESIYIGGGTEPLGSSHPEAVRFRETMSKVYQGRFDAELHQWAFDAWLGGIQFKEAVESMGPNVTRKGLMAWYNALDRYECHGLCSPRDYSPNIRKDGQAMRGCVGIVRWNEKTGEFVTWADRKDPANCVTGKWVAQPASYSP